MDECKAQKRARECNENENTCQQEIRTWGIGGIYKSITQRCKQKHACVNNHIQNPRAAWKETQCQPLSPGLKLIINIFWINQFLKILTFIIYIISIFIQFKLGRPEDFWKMSLRTFILHSRSGRGSRHSFRTQLERALPVMTGSRPF